ncbi:MAG: uracil phosphoribosyltransferase [Planctomycetaceae bacterium]|nr:uracil phosphoribosyltransferase [Planctomycetaceae bacterium]
MNLQVIEHPVVRHHLTQLRDRSTPPEQFRAIVGRLTSLLVFRATEHLALRDRNVTTPLTAFHGHELSQSIGLVPILRAGLGMIDPVLSLLPTAEVWHLGLYRDETTSQPVEYYSKLPPGRPVDVAMVLDPMLATGGSAVLAYHTLKRWGVPHVKLLSIISAPEGIDRLRQECPDLEVHVCAVDQGLNERNFIVPGLGDAGDRIFNTSGHH